MKSATYQVDGPWNLMGVWTFDPIIIQSVVMLDQLIQVDPEFRLKMDLPEVMDPLVPDVVPKAEGETGLIGATGSSCRYVVSMDRIAPTDNARIPMNKPDVIGIQLARCFFLFLRSWLWKGKSHF